MKILFISKSFANQPNIIISNQADSLRSLGNTINFFLIDYSYRKAIPALRQKLNKEHYDIIHAHYGLCGFVALKANRGNIPLVLSLMGMDVMGSLEGSIKEKLTYTVVKKISRWSAKKADAVILKSENMLPFVSGQNNTVIPNGVNTSLFSQSQNSYSNSTVQRFNNSTASQPQILFPANPSRPEKNFKLLQEAIKIIGFPESQVLTLSNIDHAEVPLLMNRADVVVLCSTQEGSPNVIKEAMACNRPIIATPVGDIPQLLKNVQGSTILPDFSPESLANAIKSQLNSQTSSNGREKIFEMKLDSESVAKRIGEVYKLVSQKSL